MQPSRACFSAVTGSARLLREFIHDALYHPSTGYFTKQAPLSFLSPPINFQTLPNQQAYFNQVLRRYEQLEVAWLTPVEIFSPHYGAVIGHYIATAHAFSKSSNIEKNNNSLEIVEIGGGTGTLALDTLNHLRQQKPDLYNKTTYRCMEISPVLAEMQYERVVRVGGHDNGRFDVVCGNATHVESWKSCSMSPGRVDTYILAMEVLDNMPHDRVVWCKDREQWMQTTVVFDDGKTTPQYTQMLQPIDDGFIDRCLNSYLHVQSNQVSNNKLSLGSFIERSLFSILGAAVHEDAPLFLPTVSLSLFDTLHTVRPHHHLIAADFDYVPEVVLPGKNAPIVSMTRGGKAVDYNSYLIDPGSADIFFPTDFELLKELYYASKRHTCGTEGEGQGEREYNGVSVMKNKEFMKRWGSKEALEMTTTQSGYNPMIEDYSNTSVLLS